MMQFLSPVRNRIEKNVVKIVTRGLAGPGKFFVQKGQEISPPDVIGSSELPSGYRTLNISKLLSVSPDSVKNYLARTVGEKIYRGELLALKKGWLFGGKKIVTSPTDGTIDFVNEKTGEVKLVFLPKKVDLPSGVFGVVEEVDNLRGFVRVRTQVSVVHGLFGTGNTRDGILHFIGTKESLITEEMIKSDKTGQVLVGGSLIYNDAISAAISAGVNGFIVGGINAKDYKSVSGGRLVFPKKLENDIGLSLVVSEGFGSLPIADDIYSFLSVFNGRFVFIEGNTGLISLPSFDSNSMFSVRQTKVVDNTAVFANTEYQQIGNLNTGSIVRVTGDYMLSQQGRVISIDSAETLLPSGVKAFLATIETKYRKIKIPVNNLEIVNNA